MTKKISAANSTSNIDSNMNKIAKIESTTTESNTASEGGKYKCRIRTPSGIAAVWEAARVRPRKLRVRPRRVVQHGERGVRAGLHQCLRAFEGLGQFQLLKRAAVFFGLGVGRSLDGRQGLTGWKKKKNTQPPHIGLNNEKQTLKINDQTKQTRTKIYASRLTQMHTLTKHIKYVTILN
jgi:hypothetical protein